VAAREEEVAALGQHGEEKEAAGWAAWAEMLAAAGPVGPKVKENSFPDKI
jgi:hypothetical protein